MAKKTKKHMSQKDIEEWEALYDYVKTNVMGYDDDQSLPRNVVLRLKGLANNKFMANNNIEDAANYSFGIILLTFKYCMPDIQRGFNSISFANESHKINYVMKIVENNLNTVYMRVKKKKKIEQEIANEDVVVSESSVEYKPKEKKKDKFADLW